MSLFSDLESSFETINATGRSSSSDLISITHNIGTKKEEIAFRISKEAMKKAKLEYRDKVQIQFAANNTVCRILKSEQGGSVTLSQQITNNDMSAGIVRLMYKQGIPNFLKMEEEKLLQENKLTKVKYIHEDDQIEFADSQITFKLKLDTYE
jgi:hypothetical protein